MNRSIYSLTEREWNQARAALRFWRAVAETSRTHPSRHPQVEGMFKQHAPLSVDEIDELLEGTPEVLYVTAGDIAKATGRNLRTVQYRLNKEKVEPALRHGQARLYRVEQVADLIETIHDEAEAW